MTESLTAFRPFAGLYEPSGIQQLPDGRFLVIEDEKEFPFCIVALDDSGLPAGPPLAIPSPDKLNDLEGLTRGPSGHLYAITSHSRDGNAEVKKSRRKIVRFRLNENSIVEAASFDDLLPVLVAAHPALAAAAKVTDVKEDGGLNIEALEMSADGASLLIGLRGPLIDGRAVVAVIEQPEAMFDQGKVPALTIRTVGLGGQGIRSIAAIPTLGGYLLISGPLSKEPAPFHLWWWNGSDNTAQPVTLPGLENFARAEGITAATVGGRPCVLLVSDDGSREDNRPAGYLLVDANRLLVGRA